MCETHSNNSKNKIILLLTVFCVVTACKKEEQIEQRITKDFKFISNNDISDYCNKHDDKFIIWYDEYAKKYGNIGESSSVDQSSVGQPLRRMQMGINAFQVTQLLFYLSENCIDGWEVVSHSSDGILLQK